MDVRVAKGAKLGVAPRELEALTDTLPAEERVEDAEWVLLNDELPVVLLVILWLGEPVPVGRRDRLVEPLQLRVWRCDALRVPVSVALDACECVPVSVGPPVAVCVWDGVVVPDWDALLDDDGVVLALPLAE